MGQEGPEQRENIKSGKAKMIARHYLPLMGKRLLARSSSALQLMGCWERERSLVIK